MDLSKRCKGKLAVWNQPGKLTEIISFKQNARTETVLAFLVFGRMKRPFAKSTVQITLTSCMKISQLFLQRYDPLYNFYLAGIWEIVPDELMRIRPYPCTNSIAWNLWHLARAEDAGLNRFVADRPQVLDDGAWMEKMNIPWRHHGSEMTLPEVDELNKRIDLDALQGYSHAVEERTRSIIASLEDYDLEAQLEEKQLRQIMVNEGLAHSNAEGFIKNYLRWTKGKCLMTFGLTHPWQHLGEMEVLASLLGVEFD